jgi:hypothetical protein
MSAIRALARAFAMASLLFTVRSSIELRPIIANARTSSNPVIEIVAIKANPLFFDLT